MIHLNKFYKNRYGETVYTYETKVFGDRSETYICFFNFAAKMKRVELETTFSEAFHEIIEPEFSETQRHLIRDIFTDPQLKISAVYMFTERLRSL